MTRRLPLWLLALYPAWWRDRYGHEVALLNEELIRTGETTPLRATLNLIAGAAIERGRMLARSRRSMLAWAAAAAAFAAIVTLTVAPAGPGIASGNGASLNCLIARPPARAHSGRTQAWTIAQVDAAGSDLARRRPACPGGQLRWVQHGRAGAQHEARPVRLPPPGNAP